jgi:hypothetical protein
VGKEVVQERDNWRLALVSVPHLPWTPPGQAQKEVGGKEAETCPPPQSSQGGRGCRPANCTLRDLGTHGCQPAVQKALTSLLSTCQVYLAASLLSLNIIFKGAFVTLPLLRSMVLAECPVNDTDGGHRQGL